LNRQLERRLRALQRQHGIVHIAGALQHPGDRRVRFTG
jgi:hypothetical protein